MTRLPKKPQTIVAPDGSTMAVLPMQDYDRLIDAAEDRADRKAAQAARARFAAGADEHIPFEMAERILDGENPLRVWREHRGLTVGELAERSGISRPYLSEIEIGRKDGTLRTMAALATALEVEIDDLLPADIATNAGE